MFRSFDWQSPFVRTQKSPFENYTTALAFCIAGKNSSARIARTEMMTNRSTRVKARAESFRIGTMRWEFGFTASTNGS